jgi:hypothetical protein
VSKEGDRRVQDRLGGADRELDKVAEVGVGWRGGGRDTMKIRLAKQAEDKLRWASQKR